MTQSTSSPWSLDDQLRIARPARAPDTADVAVIGGGIAGLTAAYLLQREGKSVVLIDAKDQVAGGETEMTTAHLAWYIDDGLTRLASIRGDATAKAAVESHRGAIGLIEEIVEREKVRCDFERVPGYLIPGQQNVNVSIDEEVKTLQRLGLPFEKLERSPLPGGTVGPALRFPSHGKFHPLKYLAAVAAEFRNLGGTIRTGTLAMEIKEGKPCEIKLGDGKTLKATDVVVATNTPHGVGSAIHLKLAAYNTYAVALAIPAGTVPEGLFWDTEDPYHYVRTGRSSQGENLLIVGGEDHRTGQASDQEERWRRLEGWTRARFPSAGPLRHHWSGQVFETADGLGMIGLAPGSREHLYLITGDSGMGMTHGTLGAKLVADLIMGRVSPYADIYSPSRWTPSALGTLISENANHAAQYRDWLTGGDVSSADQIPNGHGAIVRSGLTKLAVYRGDDGTIHKMSGVCPHLGGIVRWNPGEKTWDCPCHGSRFACDGKVLHGPTSDPLKPVE